ncbi:unnamed protein product [Arctia plantaginis]|uniref:Uncharacterized protein n=1 Tax=Arctia plantaginis TaxID=874455 RepID=A0A8S0Z339_ARCPL|nr:unnamed protein product [Arctia plantaginis]
MLRLARSIKSEESHSRARTKPPHDEDGRTDTALRPPSLPHRPKAAIASSVDSRAPTPAATSLMSINRGLDACTARDTATHGITVSGCTQT